MVLVLANKCDLHDVALPDEVTQTMQLVDINETSVCRLQPVSALTGEGLEDAIKWLHDALIRADREAIVPLY